MAMSAILYGPVDENLRDQSQSNLLYIQKIGRMTTQVGNTGQFGLVYFTVVYPEGAVAPQNPEIPPAQTVLPAAFAGQVVWATTTLTNGARVRILAQPIYLPDAVTGQRVLTAVLQAATPLDIFD